MKYTQILVTQASSQKSMLVSFTENSPVNAQRTPKIPFKVICESGVARETKQCKAKRCIHVFLLSYFMAPKRHRCSL